MPNKYYNVKLTHCISNMDKKERDLWEDAIQSKLEDFEVDTLPDDWEAIADRLEPRASIPLRRTLRYWVAAAVISLLILSGGIYVYDTRTTDLPVAQKITSKDKREPQAVESPKVPVETPSESPVLVASARQATPPTQRKRVAPTTSAFSVKKAMPKPEEAQAPVAAMVVEEEERTEPQTKASETKAVSVVEQSSYIADATPVVKKKKSKERSKWSFGMGGGSFSVGADNMLPQYVTNSSLLRNENLSALNAFNAGNFDLAKTDVRHKTPIGFGLSVSRYLNKRFALQTGLTYSYLRSEWSTNNTYHVDNEQRLHFIGIPLSLSYKIAEWNRFVFYTSAGAMTEVNVAGKRHMKLYSDEVKIMSSSEHVRMKEWLWSVNARAGVSYPIVRFISAFAEVGASYYFDNGSEIETIHSEKPFNVSLQFGFRFGL